MTSLTIVSICLSICVMLLLLIIVLFVKGCQEYNALEDKYNRVRKEHKWLNERISNHFNPTTSHLTKLIKELYYYRNKGYSFMEKKQLMYQVENHLRVHKMLKTGVINEEV